MPHDPFVTADGDSIPWLGFRAEQFLDRTTAVYGPSKSGKSVTMKAIMKLLSPLIEQVLLVSPSERQNLDYDEIVPKLMTHYRIWLEAKGDEASQETAAGASKGPPKKGRPKATTVDKDGGLRFFEDLFERQEAATSVYRQVNQLLVLKKLFDRVSGAHERRGLALIGEHRERAIRMIRRRHHGGERDKNERELSKKIDEIKRAFFKKHIIDHIEELQKVRSLSAPERFSLDRIEFNPRMLLVLDDCASELTKKIVESPVFKKLFYRGRHAMITLLIACHTPNDLAPGLRKNTFNCLFTAADSANAYFTNASNGFTAPMRKEILPLVGGVFDTTDHEYLKFAYVRDSSQRFFVFEVQYPRPFRFGGDALWEMEEEAARKEEGLARDNEFYKYYFDEEGSVDG